MTPGGPSPTRQGRAWLPPVVVRFAQSAALLAALCDVLSAARTFDQVPVDRVSVLLSAEASQLERHAAAELAAYLERLFGIRARLTSDPATDTDLAFLTGDVGGEHFKHPVLAHLTFPRLSDQGIYLHTTQLDAKPLVIACGGSPKAALWAVYELVERWGVRYLLQRDALPPRGALRIPTSSEHLEPTLKIRQWRGLNEFAMGPASWGLADYRPVLDQLAKLKFNRLILYIWPHQPFLDYEVRGIQRRSATNFFGHRFPICADMIGRELFGKATEFWNPDLPIEAPYPQLADAGRRHLRAVMEYAEQRGMDCVLGLMPLEFPPEFAPLLQDSKRVEQVGKLSIVPGPGTAWDDPVLEDLAAAVIRSAIRDYPRTRLVSVSMSEHRQWLDEYAKAWDTLNERYNLDEIISLEALLERARNRPNYRHRPERAVEEVKGDLVALCFYDRLLRRSDLGWKNGWIPDGTAEELLPLLSRILPPGSETLNFIDYTPLRVVERKEALSALGAAQMPAVLIYTLHDDNVGLLPQLTTGSLHRLTQELVRHGWAGFSTRHWLIGDQDPCVAYLAEAAWDPHVTPDEVYRDQLRAVCGEGCVEDMAEAFRQLEAATADLELYAMGLTFPVPGMIMRQWTTSPTPKEFLRIRERYGAALQAAERARRKAHPSGRGFVEYWVGRLTFGTEYLHLVQAARQAAKFEAEHNLQQAQRCAETALNHARRALQAYARVAHNQSDKGALAILNHYVYFPLRAKTMSLRNTPAGDEPGQADRH
ncbi:MAG: hypothetical protein ACE15E_00990 [Acidobacteriota bacterium]